QQSHRFRHPAHVPSFSLTASEPEQVLYGAPERQDRVLSESFARLLSTAVVTTIAVATISGCGTGSDGDAFGAQNGSKVAAPHRIDLSGPSFGFLQANRDRSSGTAAYSYCGSVAAPGPWDIGSSFESDVEYFFDIGVRDDSTWNCSAATDFFLAFFTSPPPSPTRSDAPADFSGKRCYESSSVTGFWCVSDQDDGIAVLAG
ncbi:MAG: hypothetical protein WA988_05785, partial [Candidatus Nanopelagicales bacterium]